MTRIELPALPLDEWEETQRTLHLYLQIVGKVRMALMPRRNHWWHVTLYVTPRGLGTGAIPYEEGRESFEILVDLVGHRVVLSSSRGEALTFALSDGLRVADFHRRLFDALDRLGVEVSILDRPYDLPVDRPFGEISEQARYDAEAVSRYFRLLRWVDAVFQEFRGRFLGKSCPVHLYWHHMDLAVTRFSGRRGPQLPAEKSRVEKEAYSHEVISFGFWAGDEKVRAPAFYSYTYPSPEGLDQEPLRPAAAVWQDAGGSPMALLGYDDLRKLDDPRRALLDFLESAYHAGAKRAGWDAAELALPDPEP